MADASPSSSAPATLAASVSVAKKPGTLTLSSHMMQWVPTQSSSASQETIRVPLGEVEKLLASVVKPEATTFSLKLVLFQPDDPEEPRVTVRGKSDVLFTFTAPEGRDKALSDREAFKERLYHIANANKAEREAASGKAGSSAAPLGSSPAKEATPVVRQQASAAAAASPAPPGGAAPPELSAEEKARRREQELQLRVSILQAHPELKALHHDLVIGKVMRDAEFWSHPTRAALLRSERAMLQQRQGRNAMIADPKPSNDADGNLKINLSAQMVRDIFEQYPVVAKAYGDLVPKRLDEQAFWSRYFQSKLYHRLRTSARSTASEHIVSADAIFDKYLDDVVEDDDYESRRAFRAHDTFLDLGATEEDHGETGNRKDYTMRAGAAKSTLPLLRRFNEHSTSLLDSALGAQEKGASSSAWPTTIAGEGYDTFSNEQARNQPAQAQKEVRAGDDAGPVGVQDASRRTHQHYDQIVIDELEEEQRSAARPLSLDKAQAGFFEGREASKSLTFGGTVMQPEVSNCGASDKSGDEKWSALAHALDI